MIQWLVEPKSSVVAQYIDRYWMIEKTPDDQSYNHPKLNPDPATHLILSPKEQVYSYSAQDQIHSDGGSHWLFPHHQTFQLDHSRSFVHIGIKFKVGALYSLNIPNYSHPTCDQVAAFNPTSLFGGCEVNELIKLGRMDAEQCLSQLDQILLPWLEVARKDRHSELVEKSLPLIDSTVISELGAKLFCSQRTLERSFSRVTGFTLKQYQSMNKLEAMLVHLYQKELSDIDWTLI
ncbi:AraC family transcriptional regulator, partial [Vibrio makurazakiensis]|uniref:DUF6597 domain-containing transcriptional factor n=1 Tax=Vibrio makurazakiensis TaxID=2910250 RepID=UPI003D0C46C3